MVLYPILKSPFIAIYQSFFPSQIAINWWLNQLNPSNLGNGTCLIPRYSILKMRDFTPIIYGSPWTFPYHVPILVGWFYHVIPITSNCMTIKNACVLSCYIRYTLLYPIVSPNNHIPIGCNVGNPTIKPTIWGMVLDGLQCPCLVYWVYHTSSTPLIFENQPPHIPPARARRGHAPDPARIAERSWASTIPNNGWFEPEKLGFYGRFNGGSLSQDLGFNTFQYSKSDFG